MPSASVSAGLEAALIFCAGLLGAAYLVWVGADVWQARQSLSWTKVDGKVLTAEVQKGGSKIGFCLDVTYSYHLDGGTFTGTKRSFGRPSCGSERSANELAKAYVPGAAIDVYVNPANPFKSVLLPGEIEARTWFEVAGAFFVAMVGLFGGLASLRRGR